MAMQLQTDEKSVSAILMPYRLSPLSNVVDKYMMFNVRLDIDIHDRTPFHQEINQLHSLIFLILSRKLLIRAIRHSFNVSGLSATAHTRRSWTRTRRPASSTDSPTIVFARRFSLVLDAQSLNR